MFERYTERARRVLFFARYEASQLGNRSIRPEHLLLGLVREGKGLTSRLFSNARLSLEDLRREVATRLTFQEAIGTSVEIPFDEATKRVLKEAAAEADRLLHDYIGTEHLLLGLLHETSGDAGQILAGHGLRLDAIRKDIVDLINRRPVTGDRVPAGNTGQAFRGHVSPHLPERDFARGIELKALLAQVLNANRHRIAIPPELDGHFSVAREQRVVDVYVLTVVPGRRPPAHAATDARGGGTGHGSMVFATVAIEPEGHEPKPPDHRTSLHSIGTLSVPGASMNDLARLLEEIVGLPVIDESDLSGRYDIEVAGPHHGLEAFFAACEQQAGLLLTRTRREIEVVVIRPDPH